MKNLLVTGFSERDENAILFMLARTHPDARHVVLPRGSLLSVSDQTPGFRASGQCLIDLDGVELAEYSLENERALLSFLAGRSAVLATSEPQKWAERRMPLLGEQVLIWIKSPFTASEMLAAVRGMDEQPAVNMARVVARPGAHTDVGGGAALPSGRAALTGEPAAPAWKRALALAEQLSRDRDLPASRTGFSREAAEPASHAGCGLGPAMDGVAASQSFAVESRPEAEAGEHPLVMAAASLKVLRDCFPQITAFRGMEVAEAVVASNGVLLLRPPGDNVGAQLINLSQGWVASRMTALALRFITLDSGILSKTQLEPGVSGNVDAMLQAEFEGRPYTFHALDTLMWELMHSSLGSAELKRRGDFALKMTRFPNFNRLRNYAEFDIQLAAMCARGAVSVEEMEQVFPRRKHEVRRFVVSALVSGYAVALPASSGAVPTGRASSKRGFFRALLEKLF